MADRVLTWHYSRGSCKDLPAFYADKDYDKEAVRIYAEVPPMAGDFEVDIFADGVSIFNNHAAVHVDSLLHTSYAEPSNTKVILPQGDNSEDGAGDFTEDNIDEGAWITCVVYGTGGAGNVTISLELNEVESE